MGECRIEGEGEKKSETEAGRGRGSKDRQRDPCVSFLKSNAAPSTVLYTPGWRDLYPVLLSVH